MRLILAGCEYSGTTTLSNAIDDWLNEKMGVRFSLIHDHWKIPHTTGHPPNATDEEQKQVLALSSNLKEMTQRHSLYYHVQYNSWNSPDYMSIGLHVDDSVYGPIYFGYGGVGKPHDRVIVSEQVERSMLRFAPDMVLVHVKASADIIARRMKENPHQNSALKEADIKKVSKSFEAAVTRSSIRHKISLDTTEPTLYETMAEFNRKIEAHLSESDRSRILTHRIWTARATQPDFL